MKLIDVIAEAHNLSVMINKMQIDRGWASLNAKGAKPGTLVPRNYPMIKGVITLQNVTKAEVDEALKNDPEQRFYSEGGAGCDSAYYDFMLTPTEIEKERGICTEHESHIRVPFGD